MRDVSDERAIWLARAVLPHEPALRAWLYHRRVTDLDVDDIVQEAYAKIAGLESVAEIREPKRYLFQVAYTIIAAHLRRSRVISISAVANLDSFKIAAPDASAEQELIFRDELKDLAEALADLPEPCRRAFTLRRVGGLSQRETAKQLGLSEKTIEKYMAKSVKLLMDRFGRGGKLPSHASKTLNDQNQSDNDEALEPRG